MAGSGSKRFLPPFWLRRVIILDCGDAVPVASQTAGMRSLVKGVKDHLAGNYPSTDRVWTVVEGSIQEQNDRDRGAIAPHQIWP